MIIACDCYNNITLCGVKKIKYNGSQSMERGCDDSNVRNR